MIKGLHRNACLLGISLFALVMAGCHSAGMNSTTTSAQPVAVALAAAPSSLTVTQTYQFSSMVTNTTNTAVTWSVSGMAGGNSTVGTISAGGLYTAPALVPNPQSVTITATSQADTTKSASTPVTINISLVVSAAGSAATSLSLQVTAAQVFNAAIVGAANTSVTWSVNGVAGGNSTVGTIVGDAGVYTAPTYPPSPSSIAISACSVAYPTICASFPVTIQTPPIGVTVNPTALDLQINGTVQLTDMVTTTSGLPISNAVTWSVRSPGATGSGAVGYITPTGLYTAPSYVPGGALATIPVYVQSQESPGSVATCTITITATPVPLQISTNALGNGIANSSYTATVSAFGGAQPYAWSVSAGSLPTGLSLNSATGVISGTPTVPGTFNFTVMTTDQTSPTHESTTANLSITIIPVLSITTASLPAGSVSATYNTTLTDSGGFGPYTWNIVSGSLPSGLSFNPANGAITGAPAAGTGSTTGTYYPLTFKVTDSGTPQQTQTVTLSLVVYIGPVVQTTSPINTAYVGQPYSFTVTAAGGAPPYSWTYTGLPAWLLVTPSTGLTSVISGIPPSAAAATPFTVKITDNNGVSNSATLSIAVTTVMAFPAPTPPPAVLNTAYGTTLVANGGLAPLTWTSTGTLPPGLTLSAAGVISGMPTTAGTYNFTAKVTDSSTPGQVLSQNLTIIVYTGLTITTTTLPFGIQGQAYNNGSGVQLAAAGGSNNYTWSVTAGSLPTGFPALPTTGLISGTPTATGTFNFTVTVTDTTSSQSKTANLSIAVAPLLTFSAPVAPIGIVGSAYNTSGYQLVANGGQTPLTWTSAGTLPPGVTLSSAGLLSGSPTTAGTYSFTAKVTDSSVPAQTLSQPVSITVYNPLTITTGILPFGVQGQAYNNGTGVQLAATGGSGNFSWSVTAGSLPTGFPALPTTGLISGTPSGTGTFSFTVTLTDTTSSQTKTASLSITVAPLLAFAAPTAPNGVVGTVYNTSGYQLVASGGQTPLTWTSTGTLPPGLTLSSSGLISGTPTTAGPYSFTAKVTDASSPTQSISQTVSITIYTGLTITSASPLPYGIQGQAYNGTGVQLTAAGGSNNYSWTIATGSLPTGLPALPTSGLISGTPTGTGTFNFTVMVTDTTSSQTKTANLSITVTTVLSLNNVGFQGALNQIYGGGSPTATGGTTPYTFSITTGSLPPGINLNTSTGALTGTPTVGGAYQFTVKVQDSSIPGTPQSATQTYNFGVLGFTPISLASGTVNVAYPTQTFTAANGPGPFNWSQTGTLPPGLTFTGSVSTATLSGTPTTAGTYNFTVSVSGALIGITASQSFSVTINGATLAITTASLNNGAVGTVYSQQLMNTGGASPFTWSILPAASSLPPGLSLTGATISGTPTTAGVYSFQIKVVDSGNPQQTQTSGTPSISILGINTASLPGGTVGTAYNQSVGATGGSGNYSFSIASGSLPTSLAIGAGGAITGTPTVAGLYSFSVMVTDNTSHLTAQQALSINVVTNSGSLSLTTASLPNGQAGSAYGAQLAATGGVTPYTWTVVSGSLPQCTNGGVSFTLNSSSGLISGTADGSCVGTSNFVIQVTDSTAGTHLIAQKSLSITINSAPMAACGSGNEAILQGQYAFQLKGFDGANSFEVFVGSMTLDGAGNIVSGEADWNIPGLSSSATTNFNVTGTYSMGADNRGCAMIRLNAGVVTLNVHIVVGAISGGTATQGQIIEFDSPSSHAFVASGPLIQQTTTTTPSTSNFIAPNATYAYLWSGWDSSSNARIACGGIETLSGGSISNPQYDCNEVGTVTSVGPTAGNVGTVSSVDQYGRFTTAMGSGASANDLIIYTNSAVSQALMLTTETGGANTVVMAGQAVLQTVGPYNSSSLNGNFVYNQAGTNGNGSSSGFARVGVMSSDGTNISGTYYTDSADTIQSAATTNCPYTVGSNGRVVPTNPSTCSFPNFYLTGTNTGFVLGTGAGVGAGQLANQTVPNGGFNATNSAGTYFGGTAEVINQNANPEIDLLTLAGGSGSNLAGTDVVDDSASTFQQTDNVNDLTGGGVTIASNGVIMAPTTGGGGGVGVAVDSTHFWFIDNAAYPNLVTYGTTTADSSVAVSITNPTGAQTVAPNGTISITDSVTGSANEVAAGVTWTVNGYTNGNSEYGTITGSGTSFTYTAPATVPLPETFAVTATSNADSSKSASFNVTISAGAGGPVTVSTSSLPGGTVGVAYQTTTLMATGGTGPYTWTITAGGLPLGLAMSTGGVISGTPLAINTPSFTVQATDTNGTHMSGTQVLSITVATSASTRNAIDVVGGQGGVSGINLNISTSTPTLGLADIGLCTGNPFPCNASVASVSVTKGTAATVWLIGQVLTNGAGSALASGLTISVSQGTTADVTVTNITPQALVNGLTDVTFTVTVSAGATSGPRNLIVTNAAGEVQAFIGAIEIP